MNRTGESRMRDVVATADRVVVVDGTTYDAKRRSANRVLAELAGRRAVDEVVDALACEDGDRATTEPGGPSLVFLEGRSVAAIVTLVGTDLLRAPALWPGDARLIDPGELLALLPDLPDDD